MTGFDQWLLHAGEARLIERVLRSDADEIEVATTRHRANDNPLRRNGRLSAVHLAEFGAQVIAAHGGMRDRAAGREPQPALLVSVRDFTLAREYLDDLEGELRITARLLLANETSWQYSFTVWHAGTQIASGRLAAMTR